MPRVVLQARGLHKHYADVHAVAGIEVDVPNGRIVGLVGNNGAGKTTAIKMFSGLVEPTQGTVRIDGEDPLHAPTRARLGFLPEDSPLYDDLSPLGYLRYFGRIYGMRASDSKERGRQLLTRLRLEERYWSRPIGNLSKGSARKVALARALLHDPDLVILDEPSSGLDPATQRVLDAFLLDLRAEGKAVLLSAHDLEQVERVCDDILVMHQGRIVLRGDLDALRGRAGATRYQVRATVPFPGSHGDGPDHVLEAEDWQAAEQALTHVVRGGGRVLGVQAIAPHLADVIARVSEA